MIMSNNNNNKYKNKTLGSLLHYWEGLEVAVELKTGKIYRGILVSADHDMTVTLQRVAAIHHPTTTTASAETADVQNDSQQELQRQLSMLQIRGSKIRYIHFIEHNIDLARMVKQGMERERAASQKYKRGIRKT